MTESEKAFVETEDKLLQKKWTDAQRWQRLKTNKVGSPPRNKMGHVSDTLRPLVKVEKYCLCVGQMFPNKDIFWMRIAKEALLRNINVRAVRSEYTVLIVCGPSFHCKGTFREALGWKCKVTVCREGNDTSNIPDRTTYDNMNKPLHTPLYYKWVIPIFCPLVKKKPGIDYEALRCALRPFANDSAITNPILQRGRDAAKYEIFGTPEENAWYAECVIEKMHCLGHTAELVISTRAKTMETINTTVVSEEVHRQKNKKGERPLDGINERKEFWKTWKEEHALFLSKTLGIEGGPFENKFLTGILVASSVSKTMFNATQEVVQADGAHTSFGKYTLFSAYTTTANSNIANVAFGILFGNEDTNN
jgi:hypothetical protein